VTAFAINDEEFGAKLERALAWSGVKLIPAAEAERTNQ
jgi:hypothetical protein